MYVSVSCSWCLSVDLSVIDTYGPSSNLDQDGDAKMEEEESGRQEYDVLIRCTDGMEINFATRVSFRFPAIGPVCCHCDTHYHIIKPLTHPFYCTDLPLLDTTIPAPALSRTLRNPLESQHGSNNAQEG